MAAAGVVWACGGYEEEVYSVFNPEYFVDKQYSPFFYGVPDSLKKSDPLVTEWRDYFKQRLTANEVHNLIYHKSLARVDSVYQYLSGQTAEVPFDFPTGIKNKLDQKEIKKLYDYFLLAKQCEKFADMPQRSGWDAPPDTIIIAPGLNDALAKAFKKSNDTFIKERLWFQLVRLKYFDDKATTAADSVGLESLKKGEVEVMFNKYSRKFPKNLMYYRALGYVAGYYYRHKQYAQANYLYSLCFNYTSNDLKISSDWSFHPQDEEDWKATLQLAKNDEEKITLWEMLGIENDPDRAIKEIAALNPASDKVGPLLGRIINGAEFDVNNPGYNTFAAAVADTSYSVSFPFSNDHADISFADSLNKSAYLTVYNADLLKDVSFNRDIHLVDSLAGCKFINRPYFWHLAAGYLHYLHYDYTGAGKFYAQAQKELPVGNNEIMAQYKLLYILLSVHQLKHIDSDVENRLVEPLTWLADLRDQKSIVNGLLFNDALTSTVDAIARAYQRQGDKIKALLFNNEDNNFYGNYKSIDSVLSLLNKPNKSAFEQVMLRYYPIKKEELYYQQALIRTCQENTGPAILLMEKAGDDIKNEELYANPFDNRLKDCHDCDFAAPQKRKYTRLSFLQTLKTALDELKAGKDIYNNAYLLGNAYYNISNYGNASFFYARSVNGSNFYTSNSNDADTTSVTISITQEVPERYYLKALNYASTDEQRARCTFMLSKCERNKYYDSGGEDIPPDNKYFASLKARYSKTKYYWEVLNECGYFKRYVDSVK